MGGRRRTYTYFFLSRRILLEYSVGFDYFPNQVYECVGSSIRPTLKPGEERHAGAQ